MTRKILLVVLWSVMVANVGGCAVVAWFAAVFSPPAVIPPEYVFPRGETVLVLVDDPGNIGALVRTGLACGAAAFVGVGCSDPFHPQVARPRPSVACRHHGNGIVAELPPGG